MQILSPELKLVKQIPIPKPNSELLLSPSYISCVASSEPNKYCLILTGKKILYSLEIKFYDYSESNENSSKNQELEDSISIQYKITNHQKKGKKSKSFSAGLMLNENSALVGGFEGSLLVLDMRERYLAKLNKVHLDAIHHLQKINSSELDQGILLTYRQVYAIFSQKR
jgi:hypothetical protein